jgi:hypothetical protein
VRNGPKVVVSKHCMDKLRHRDPGFFERTKDPVGAVYHEVQVALREGRKAAHPPAWCRTTRGKRRTRRSEEVRAARFVWDDQRQRCYVLRPRPNKTWGVATVLVRREESHG